MSFDFIDRKFGRSPETNPPKPKVDWWCDSCGDLVDGGSVTYEETHVTCGRHVEPYCATCESGGWVQVYSHSPPSFGECPDCCNPFDRESP